MVPCKKKNVKKKSYTISELDMEKYKRKFETKASEEWRKVINSEEKEAEEEWKAFKETITYTSPSHHTFGDIG